MDTPIAPVDLSTRFTQQMTSVNNQPQASDLTYYLCEKALVPRRFFGSLEMRGDLQKFKLYLRSFIQV